jgi:hypothetical protein
VVNVKLKVPVDEGVPDIVKTLLLKLPDNPEGKFPEVIEAFVAKPPILKSIGLIIEFKHKVGIGALNVILGSGLITIEKLEVEAV